MDLIQPAVLIFVCLLCHFGLEGRNVDFADRTFVSVWNAPSAICESKFGVQLDLSYFDIVANHNETFEGEEIVIFYGSSLGLLPSIDAHGKFIHGGLPQLANITAHLAKVARDVEHYMPSVDFTGLAVIDWESWRPIFARDNYNQGMRRYIQASENLVRKLHPDWSKKKIENEARKEFETAARLSWLFEASTSLYPSIYLTESGTPTDRYKHVYGQLKEALRVKKKYGGKYLPIAPYSKFRHDTGKFYSQADLNNTILQAAEAGLNAIVLWGSLASFRSARDCEQTRAYLDSTLGPFIKNVTITARNCSDELCNSHGRCFKTDWNYKSNTPDTLFFESATKRFFAKLLEKLLGTIIDAFVSIRRTIGDTHVAESDRFGELCQRYSEFSCDCFKGWTGQYCQQITT
ncbi:hyaluronidase-1-like isoform X2 [Mercenaria mercenaria]|uniref:hyaluronidase-1-like isoform X2 n=1 Tax=Mercenaria mercenaria TaxID=6596 RepID=UPI00234F4A20|nr:hyaluronidase-1-like isoform X2 [Mercenaria mercenaria]